MPAIPVQPIMVLIKGSQPIGALPKGNVFQNLSKAITNLFSGKSGSITKTGLKVGAGAGFAGLGLFGLGKGAEEAQKSPLSIIIILAVIAFVFLFLLRR